MSSLSKKGTRGSIVLEAAIVFPILVLGIVSIIRFFGAFHSAVYFERCFYSAARELILDNSGYGLFHGIIEDSLKREILRKEFLGNLDDELRFREVNKDIDDIQIDFSDIFRYGQNEGYIKYSCKISGIEFTGKAYLKAMGRGIGRRYEWDDVWHLEPMLRGTIIIQRMGGNTGKFFELISRFREGEAAVIKSIDPDSPSYGDAGSIFKRLYPYIQKLAEYDRLVKGERILSKKFIVVVPKDARSIYLEQELQELGDACRNAGISFEVISYGKLYD